MSQNFLEPYYNFIKNYTFLDKPILLGGGAMQHYGIRNCGHDLDRSWEWSSGKTHMLWTIKNKTNKSIVITSVGLWAKDNKTEMLRKKKEYYIKPFGVKEIRVYVGDLNLDVSGSGFTSCRYGTISTTNTYKPPKKKKSGAKKFLEKIFEN